VKLLGGPRVLIRLQDPAEITDNSGCQPNAITDYSQEAGPVGNVQKLSEQEIQAKLTEEMEDLLSKGGINPLIGMSGMYLVHISQSCRW
jgi:hypothetical protein